MNIKSILLIASMFEMRSLISLAHSMDETRVVHLQRSLSDLLNKQIDEKTIDGWVDKNPFIEGLNGHFMKLDDKSITTDYYDSIISTTSEEPEDVKVQESSLVPGHEDIPNLYRFKGDFIDINEDASKFPSEYGQYNFILNSIQALFSSEGELNYPLEGDQLDSDIPNIAINFIKNNKEKIDSILRFAEYLPRYLGAGVDGVAFDIGKNFVLKLYSSENLHNNDMRFLHQLHENPELSKTELMTYDAGILGEVNEEGVLIKIYYVINEKLIPAKKLPYSVQDYISLANKMISKQIKDDKSEWKNLLPIFKNPNKFKDQYDNAMKQIRAYAQHLANDVTLTLENEYEHMKTVGAFNDFAEENSLKDDWLEVYIEEILFKLLTRRGDLHQGNLGMTKTGYFRFFDSSHPDWTESLNMPGWNNW